MNVFAFLATSLTFFSLGGFCSISSTGTSDCLHEDYKQAVPQPGMHLMCIVQQNEDFFINIIENAFVSHPAIVMNQDSVQDISSLFVQLHSMGFTGDNNRLPDKWVGSPS